MWSKAREGLLTGSLVGDEAPAEGDPRWGLSLVAGVGGKVRVRLSRVLEEITACMRGGHFVYPVDYLHMTVRSLEGYQETVNPEVIRRYREQIENVLRHSKPFVVDVRGLSATGTGVFACGYGDAVLAELRANLHSAAIADGPFGVAGADAERVRDMAHVSLTVFRGIGEPEPELVALVDRARHQVFGTLRIAELSLVSYVWMDDALTMREIGKFDLAARSARPAP